MEKGMATHSKTFITPEEYLDRERAATTKSAYYRGEMFAMAGASRQHVLIVTNCVVALVTKLGDRDCEVYSTDMRLLVAESGLYTYPDVMVVCGKPILLDKNGDVLTNPLLIVEVLSESTADYDRGGKFQQYMQIPSLKEYLTISQTEPLVDHWLRQRDNSWLLRQIRSGDGVVSLLSLGVDLKLSDLYKKVQFASNEERS
jgi:Uma2 family endonuclease